MKSHHLSVTTLEEYEPNPEFIGRNFNNGEVIQLVLRSRNGGWVSFNMVQMVMMHELAHNMHMNHGKSFWETRNRFSEEMRVLWRKGYTGEGFWGGGRCLGDLREVVGNNAMTAADLSEVQVCGGTFRSRRRKRKLNGNGGELTWKEKRDRRIEKKFGKAGQSLGEDEDKRMMLEIGRKGPIGAKPRVAQSKRGRELRAAAALARLDSNKEIDELKKTEAADSEDEYDETDVKGEDARDINGQRLLDGMGSRMVKICEEDDGDDVYVKQELAELEGLEHDLVQIDDRSEPSAACKKDINGTDEPNSNLASSTTPTLSDQPTKKRNPLYDIPQYRGSPTPPPSPDNKPNQKKQSNAIKRLSAPDIASQVTTPPNTTSAPVPRNNQHNGTLACPICSLTNGRLNPTCLACAHVLDPTKDPKHWQCKSEACSGSHYVNAGDVGLCGVCGEKKAV
jgi:DNA-dependent metalloprotease WSS1